MKQFYCPECGEGVAVPTAIRWVEEEFEVRGETIRVQTEVRFCGQCGTDIFDPELDDRTLERAYSEYRRIHSVLSGPEIADLRARYGLSQRSLAQLLGWGQITIHRYEAGSLPSEAHNQILKSLADPMSIRRLLEEHPGRLSPTAEAKLRERVDAMLVESTSERLAGEIKRVLEDQSISEFSGYRAFDLDRLGQIVAFFASRVPDLFKTKLMKLLWYSDFIHFQRNALGITGAVYAHLPNGPALDHWQALLAALEEQGFVQMAFEYGPNWEGERIAPKIEPDLSCLSEEERAIITFIAERLGDKTARELSDLSHAESGYNQTSQGELISYHFATDLRVTLDCDRCEA